MEIYKIYFAILQLLILQLVSMRRTGTYDVLEVRLLRYQRQSQQPSNTMDCERCRCKIYVSMFIKVPNATRSCVSNKETYSFVSEFRDAIKYDSSFLRPLQVPRCDGKKMNVRRFKDLQLQLDVSRHCSVLHVKCEPFTSNYTYEISYSEDGKESNIGVDIERTGMRLTFGYRLSNNILEDLKHVRTRMHKRAAVIHYNTSANGTKLCHKGWTGSNCNHNIDDCVCSLCYNGGTCKDMVNGYVCMCSPDFTGYQCEYRITTPSMMKSTVLPKTYAPLVKSTLLPKTTGLLVRTTLLPKTTTVMVKTTTFMVKTTLLPPKTTTYLLVKTTLLPETTSLMVKTTLLPKPTTLLMKTILLTKTTSSSVKTTLLPKTASLLVKATLLPKITSLMKTALLPKTTSLLVKTTLLPQTSSFLVKTTLLPKSTSISRRKSLVRAVSLSSSTSKLNLATKHKNPSSDNISGHKIKKQSTGGLPWWWWIPLVAGVVLILSVIVAIVAFMKCNKIKRQVTDQAVLKSFPVTNSNQGYNKQNINNPDVQKQFTLRVENISF